MNPSTTVPPVSPEESEGFPVASDRTRVGLPANDEPAIASQLTGEERPAAIPLPSNPLVILQAAQFTLLLMAALYFTRPIVLPVLLAILLKLLLQPGVRKLER